MRRIVTLLLIGLALGGCLSDDESNILGEVSGNQADPGNTGQPGNSSPAINGTPPTAIMYDERYKFVPNSSDADGDSLRFSVTNKPRWANFDTSTGKLSGRPGLGDVGTYDGIRIKVTDGLAQSSLSAFSIAVNQSAMGNVTLSWNAPAENTDGSPLVDLNGYKIYYGKESGVYDNEIQIDNVGMTTIVVDQLSPATYYFAATAFNAAGVESDYSGEAIKVVN